MLVLRHGRRSARQLQTRLRADVGAADEGTLNRVLARRAAGRSWWAAAPAAESRAVERWSGCTPSRRARTRRACSLRGTGGFQKPPKSHSVSFAASHPGSVSAQPPASSPQRERGTLSVVVPLYNEEGNVPELLRRLVEILERVPDLDAYEIIAVDDGSKDGTLNALRAAAATLPQLVIVSPLAQLRPPDRRDRRARRGARRRGHPHGRRSAGPAGADPALRREMARGVRRRLRDPPRAARREPLQTVHRAPLLPDHRAADQRRDPGRHRRLPADEPARRRRA